MRLAKCMIAAVALLSPALVAAQNSPAAAPSSTDERRLTPEQVEAILAEAAKKNATAEKHAPVQELTAKEAEQAPLPPVHGEVGIGTGTGGYRQVFGTAIYPVGNDGMAAISLDFVDWGKRRYPR